MATITRTLATPRRVGPRAALAVLLVFALAAAAGFVGYTRVLAPPAVPVVAGQPVRVQRGTVAATISATGSVIANRQSKLAMQVGGKLVEVPVKLGDQVRAGQILARVDTAPLHLKLSDAETQLESARVKLDQLQAGARPEEIAQAESSVTAAQARLADVQAGSIPQDVAAQQAAVDSAAANVRGARAKLDQVKAGATAADLSVAQNALANAQSSLQKAQLALDTLRAGTKPEDIRQQELAIEQAKNSLWAQQISRDNTCSRPGGGCDAARASVAAAESAVTQANEKLKNLKNPADPKDVAQKQADVDAAQDALRNAQVKIDALKAGATDEDLRQTQAALDGAQSGYVQALARLDALKQGAKAGDVEAARTSLVQAQQQLALKRNPTTIQDLRLAQLAVRSAQNAVDQITLDIANSTLTAPYDGVLGAIASNLGEQVGTGTAIMTLVDPKEKRIDVTVDESDISKIGTGKTAQIAFDALPDRRFTGKVIGVAPTSTVTQGVATYIVSVSIESADASVPVGMTANVNIVTAQKDNTLFLPNRAIRRQGRNQVVDVLVAEGKTETRTIQTGLANDQSTEVVDGVAEGETAIIPATTTTQPRVPGFGGGPPGR